MSSSTQIGWALAAALAAADVVLFLRWQGRERRGGIAERVMAAGVWIGTVVAAALAFGAVSASPAARYASVWAGLVLGPLVFTAGWTAAMSKRYRQAVEGPLLMLLGALIAVLIFLAGKR